MVWCVHAYRIVKSSCRRLRLVFNFLFSWRNHPNQPPHAGYSSTLWSAGGGRRNRPNRKVAARKPKHKVKTAKMVVMVRMMMVRMILE